MLIKINKQIENIQKHSKPFHTIDDLAPLIKKAGKAKYVLLGEATHGTSEFYSLRAEITKKLIEDHGFSFVAVEGDWPSCFEANSYIKNRSTADRAEDVLGHFNRWPTWMWANQEIIPLLEWLKNYNSKQDSDKMAGFYGLDVYSLWESMEAIIQYLQKTNSPHIDKALKAIECFEPYNRKPQTYGMSAALLGESCRQEVLDVLQSIRKHSESNSEEQLSLEINSLVSKNAENYYKTMITDDQESWNIRDHHMVEALSNISKFHGSEAKGIIWEHNTHIGDARATTMELEGLENVGQITREKFGKENIFSVGFGTYTGTVIAAEKWGAPFEIMPLPKAMRGSWEELLHRAGAHDKFLIFTDENKHLFEERVGHRAVGVVYHPEYEKYGNYVPSSISERYDSFIHVDKTQALSPLPVEVKEE